jgi:hypothetical protein
VADRLSVQDKLSDASSALVADRLSDEVLESVQDKPSDAFSALEADRILRLSDREVLRAFSCEMECKH